MCLVARYSRYRRYIKTRARWLGTVDTCLVAWLGPAHAAQLVRDYPGEVHRRIVGGPLGRRRGDWPVWTQQILFVDIATINFTICRKLYCGIPLYTISVEWWCHLTRVVDCLLRVEGRAGPHGAGRGGAERRGRGSCGLAWGGLITEWSYLAFSLLGEPAGGHAAAALLQPAQPAHPATGAVNIMYLVMFGAVWLSGYNVLLIT